MQFYSLISCNKYLYFLKLDTLQDYLCKLQKSLNMKIIFFSYKYSKLGFDLKLMSMLFVSSTSTVVQHRSLSKTWLNLINL